MSGRELLAACRVLAGEGLAEAFGHVSIRTPDQSVMITPRRGLNQVASEGELVLLSLNQDDVTDPVAPPEAHIHLAIYRRRGDVGAICRCHPSVALALSTLGEPLRPTVGYGAYLGNAIPIHDDPRLVRTRGAGERLVDTLRDGAAVLLRGNGAVTVGATVRSATVRMVFLEKLAEALAIARSIGEPRYFSAAEVGAFSLLPDAHSRQIDRAWESYVWKHTPGMVQPG